MEADMIDTLKKLGRYTQNIDIYRDDDEWRGFALQYEDDSGITQSIDWESVFARIVVQVKQSQNLPAELEFDSDDNGLIFRTETVDDTTYYIMEVPLTWQKTRGLKQKDYYYDIETHTVYDTDKTFKWTPIGGKITIYPDVTRTEE
jgi:hypothetical protein